MKSYILTIEKRFPEFHKLSGQNTNYKELILSGHKIHTIRSKVDYWKNIIEKINNKEGYLSLRQWEAIPYQSKSIEFLKIYKCGTEEIQKINGNWTILKNNQIINEFHLAENDGLNLRSLNYYFPNPFSFKLLIIHFTDFLYEYQTNPIKPIIQTEIKTNQQQTFNF